MSLARLALRLAAVEALCPAALVEAGPYPTLAGARIYDSRIDPIAGEGDFAAIEGKPLVIVYTEKHSRRPYAPQENRYPAAENFVDLTFELLIAARGEVEVDLPDGGSETIGTLTAPVTDRQHEALLDILEAQICRTLDRKSRASSASLFHKIATEVHATESVPQRADDRMVRLAARTLHFKIKIFSEVWDPSASAGTLPSPLSLVASVLPPGSSGAAICALAAAALGPGPGVPTPGLADQIALYTADLPTSADPVGHVALGNVALGP